MEDGGWGKTMGGGLSAKYTIKEDITDGITLF